MATTRSRHQRTVIVVALLAAAASLSACTTDPPPTPGDPTTPWLAAGCLDSPVPGVPDFYFTGIANAADNVYAFANDAVPPALSEDGTCTGTPTEHDVMVRTADAAGAIEICADLGQEVVNPPRPIDYGYVVPIDAWLCLDA